MKVNEAINSNIELLYKLDKAGVKSIATAIDYATIYTDYNAQSHIKNEAERKRTVAVRFKVSVSCVEKAVYLMRRTL